MDDSRTAAAKAARLLLVGLNVGFLPITELVAPGPRTRQHTG